MECYSLNRYGGYSVGIYTSLENLYIALKDCVYWSLKHEYSKEEIMENYEVRQVTLDCEPLKLNEFTAYGKKVEIDWNKIFF